MQLSAKTEQQTEKGRKYLAMAGLKLLCQMNGWMHSE